MLTEQQPEAHLACSELLNEGKFVHVSIETPPKNIAKRLEKTGLYYPPDVAYLRLEAIVDPAMLDFAVREGLQRSDHEKLVAATVVSDAVENFLLCTELASPSLIDTYPGIVVVGRRILSRIAPKSSHHDVRYSKPYDLEWPPISQLSCLSTCTWLAGTSYLQCALPRNRVERTFAAFTHVVGLTQHRSGETLFRAMQGLESFFCDGIGDLRKQLADKAAIWLGSPGTKKNIVGALYDHRSKFVHGSAPFEYFLEHLDAWEVDEKGRQAQWQSEALAVALLVSTLQKCVRDNVHDIAWEFQVKKLD